MEQVQLNSRCAGMERLAFRGKWRAYQQRVLNELARHLKNEHLHVVAAPGSGKTVLGLEVMRRIGKATVILSPTVAIRNQWAERLSMFLDSGEPVADLVSFSLLSPKMITIVTYQALHSAFSGTDDHGVKDGLEQRSKDATEDVEDGELPLPASRPRISKAAKERVISSLKRGGVTTMVLDEAHHLRNEWWKALIILKNELDSPKIVALTATPPYDVDEAEWQRYQELCGPIDVEISVPELVLTGDLCPHQDYVYFSLPRPGEASKLRQFRSDRDALVQKLEDWTELRDTILRQAWMSKPHEHIELILDDPEFFSSTMIMLRVMGASPPQALLALYGAGPEELPDLNFKWVEVFLSGLLYRYRGSFGDLEASLKELERELRRIGALESRKLSLSNPTAMQKLLASSASKMDAILDITKTEVSALRERLRMVVLCDYIRKSEMPSQEDDQRPLTRMGVIPVFETLRRSNLNHAKLGVLTGSLIIVPNDSSAALRRLAERLSIDLDHIQYAEARFDARYVTVEITGKSKEQRVKLITELFVTGHITVLIGTQALLGEGWDAPALNTLIIASTVGSFMLSNQMRGRAIRVDPTHPDKTANIWHLAAADPETTMERIRREQTGETERQTVFDPFDDLKQDLGSDVTGLKRRFRAFEGLSFKRPYTIETGFGRLGLTNHRMTARDVVGLSERMKGISAQRDCLHEAWKEALRGDGGAVRMEQTLAASDGPSGIVLSDTIKRLLTFCAFVASSISLHIGSLRMRSVREFLFVASVMMLMAAFYMLPSLYKAVLLVFRNGSIEDRIAQAGRSVIRTLSKMGLLETDLAKLRVEAVQNDGGIVFCRLAGGSTLDNSRFIQGMDELLSPVQNPRYILVRRSKLGLIERTDYHAVPALIGQKKEHAEYFTEQWNDLVGAAELVFTRSEVGRLVLLQARAKAFSAAFRKPTERISKWQ